MSTPKGDVSSKEDPANAPTIVPDHSHLEKMDGSEGYDEGRGSFPEWRHIFQLPELYMWNMWGKNGSLAAGRAKENIYTPARAQLKLF